MTRKRITTTKLEIATYWRHKIDAQQTSISFEKATSHCWRCGIKKRLDRCHIVPSSHGGQDTPDNYILLCKHCHIDNPNLDNVTVIWDWLQAYALHEDETLWFNQGLREFDYIYGISLDEALARQGYRNRDEFETVFADVLTTVGHHFGQPRHNRATIAGAIHMALTQMEEKKTL